MYMSKCCPLMPIVSISLCLTVSFFVLFALRKVAEKWLKVFGYLAVSLLLLTALIVLSGAVFKMANGLGGMKCNMMQRMKKCGMGQMMQKKNMPNMAMPEAREFPGE